MDTPKQPEGDPTPPADNWPDGFAPDPPHQELVPGTYGNLTILPGAAFPLTPEELTWPVVDYSVHPPRVKSPGQAKPPVGA
jgi:hypothetical protein